MKLMLPLCVLIFTACIQSAIKKSPELADGSINKPEALERPQLYFENGKRIALLCAVNETLAHSYNGQIPLKQP